MKIMLVLAGFVLLIAFCVISTSDMAQAEEVLGTGTESLLGGDLTRPRRTMVSLMKTRGTMPLSHPTRNPGSGAGEFSFNVFDNRLGPINDKWCCGKAGGIPKEGLWVMAEFEEQYALTHLHRIFSERCACEGPDSVGGFRGRTTARSLRPSMSTTGKAFGISDCKSSCLRQGKTTRFKKTGYRFFRHVTFDTASNPAGAYFQIGEIEFFGDDSFPVDP